jgi:NAD+ kinase
VKDAVGILFHPRVDPALPALVEARRRLERGGLAVWEVPREARERDLADKLKETRLVLTLGGDGTLLYGARLAAPWRIALLGVNLGRLGFLTEVDLDGLLDALERFFRGAFRVEERTMLQATASRDGRRLVRALGLNEVAIHRSPDESLVRLRLAVDDQEVGTFDADGALVATASGSTAYALAAGGPILEPTIEGLLLVPMSPFALTVRPIVFPPNQALTVELVRGLALLSIDGGRSRQLREGDRVRVAAYARRLRLVRLDPPERFYELMRQKLGWGLPLVPTP